MVYPGTPVLSVENPARLTASLSSVDMSAAPLNEHPNSFDDRTGSSFDVNAYPPTLIGFGNVGATAVFPAVFWAMYTYGVNHNNFGVDTSDSFLLDPGDDVYYAGGDNVVDGYAFKTLSRGSPSSFAFEVGHAARPTAGYDTNTTTTYVDGPLEVRSILTVSTVPTSVSSGHLPVRFPGSSPANPTIGTLVDIFETTPPNPVPRWTIFVQYFGDDRTPVLWNAYRFDVSISFDYLVGFPVGGDVYIFGQIYETDGVTVSNTTCIMKITPQPYVLDGAGTFDCDIILLSVDIPALQDHFDNYTGPFPDTFISGSADGFLISFLDGADYKLILMALDGSTYRYVDIETLDAGAAAMLANFEAQTTPIGDYPYASNFVIHDGDLYLISGPVDSPAFCFGPLSSSSVFKRRPNVIVN